MSSLVCFDNIPWIQITNGMRCKTYSNGQKTIRLIELSEGFEEDGWCTKNHTNYVLEGEFTTDFDGHSEIFAKGDVVYIPDGKKHKAIINKNQRVVMLDF